MEFLNFLLAISPIALVLVGILSFKKPAMKVAPVALLWTVLLALTYFNINGLTFSQNVAVLDAELWKGIKEGFKIAFMVFGAFVILNTLKKTGAIEDVKHTVAAVSGQDRRVQLIIIGMMVPIFLEGAAGLTTINGGAALVDGGVSTVAMNSAMVGRFHMFGVLVIPFLMVALAFGRKGFKGIVPYLLYAGVTTGAVMFILSNFVGPEITSMGTGLLAILLSVAYVKAVPIHTPEAFQYKVTETVERKYSAVKALSPYIYILILLPLVRYGVPALWPKHGFAAMCTFGYIGWVDAVIFLCALLGAFTLGVNRKELSAILTQTVKNVMPVMVTMSSLLIVSYIMQSGETGMITLVAKDIAGVAKGFYPAAAVLIGAMGSFITGTGLGSNLMFAPLHMEAAATLGMNPVTIFAGQNAAASLGNLICPNNTVAACATVGEVGNESKVMKKTLAVFAVLLALYMVLAMLYTLVLFPDYGRELWGMLSAQ